MKKLLLKSFQLNHGKVRILYKITVIVFVTKNINMRKGGLRNTTFERDWNPPDNHMFKLNNETRDSWAQEVQR